MSNANAEFVTCAACGQSCEGKPHAKDTKGRIICRPCIDKRKAQRAATDTGGAAVMADLLAKSKMANATPCPGCQSYMPEGATLCTHCGYNTETGKAMTTRVVKAPKQKKASDGGGMSFDPMMGVWIMAALYTGLAIGSFAVPGLAFALIGVLLLHGGITGIWLWVVMILDGDIVWFFLSLIPLLGFFLLLYYIVAKLERPALRAHYVLSLIFAIVTGALAGAILPEDTFAVAPTHTDTLIRHVA